MNGFAAEWLALRAAADAAARAGNLTRRLKAWRGGFETLDVVDFGAGTGANFRFLAPRLGGPQHWSLVDRDRALLDAFAAATRSTGWQVTGEGGQWRVRGPGFEARVSLGCEDIAGTLENITAGARLLTASALLDLVTRDWLGRLATVLAQSGRAGLFVLNYCGGFGFGAADPDDDAVLEAFNRHQRGDKGMGPALGPAAVDVLAEDLDRLARHAVVERSDWRLEGSDRALALRLVEGWCAAAAEVEPHDRERFERWRRRRVDSLDDGGIRVDHLDLLTLPG